MFCYRGAKYQAKNHLVNTVATEITARFLGQTYTLRQANYQSPRQSDLYKYRGIVYQK
ncbi:DUF4278 domain-containing protein [Pleurocapsales cyanobacterium LEGE 10410]|nr:DUF4278 domain-containing protein [Pleurocapsales cyanobacterium LEGE 10410]